MEGPRSPNPTEYSRILEFLNRNLRQNESWSISNEYPTAINENNLGNIRIIEENGEILSHAVLRPLLIKTPLGLFKVAAIGSVVTDPRYRSQGLSSRIVEDCLEAARAQGCDFAILWTNLYEFYRKFGFELAGSEVSYVIEKDLPFNGSEFKFVQSNKLDPEPMLRLFSQHTVSTIRTFDETRRYLEIPNSRVFSAWDNTGALRAYAVEGKGADLQGYIHEWGGGVSALLPLLQYIRQAQQKPLTLISPLHATNLRQKLTELKVREVQGFLGMVKILNPASLFGKVLRYARTELGVSEFVFEQRQNKFYFGVGKNIFCTDSELDVVKQWKAAPSKQSVTTANRKEGFEERRKRAAEIFKILNQVYPDAECALIHKTPFQLLIATILSAQCTDARVNMVTPGLFKKYPTPKDFANAPIEDIEKRNSLYWIL